MSTTKVVLITGASSGIGQAIARLLSREGFRVFGTSRKPELAQAQGFTIVGLDINSPESIQACLEAVLAQAGRLDILINNAGYIGPAAAGEEISQAQLRAVFETNFFGTVQMINAVLPGMRRQGGGQIITVSSMAGLVSAPPFFGAYAASKHALEGYIEALRYEVQPFNIRVALVEPGYIKTGIDQTIQEPDQALEVYARWRQQIAEMDRFGVQQGRDPQLIAQALLRLIQDPSPPLRSVIGLDALAVVMSRRFLPYAVGEGLLRWFFLSEACSQGKQPPWGLRRLVLNSRFTDAIWRGGLVGLVSLAALLVGFGLRRRKG